MLLSSVSLLRLCLIFMETTKLSGHLTHVLSRYETLHSSDLVAHHVVRRRRDADLGSFYKTKRIVSFSSFERTFRLSLYQQEGLFTDDVSIAEITANETKDIYLNENEFYAGFLDGESRSLKTFAYWEDDNLVATIRTRNDTYFVEPSWRHLPSSSNYTMIMYRLSDFRMDVQSAVDRVAFCSPPERNDSFSDEEFTSTNSLRNFGYNVTERKERLKRQSVQQKNSVCTVMLVADYRFFNSIGDGSVTNSAKYMIGVLSRVNNIYMNTDFGNGFANLGFEIQGVLVHSSPSVVSDGQIHYNMERSTWDTNALLNAFSMNDNWKQYCLVHLFTYTSFDNGVLGLAWVASDKVGSLGGICSPCSTSNCYNTGWSTTEDRFQNKMITLQADLVTAHELGHGWGAQHDPDTTECSPSSSGNGKYVMYAYSSSGLDPNNNQFSPCSKRTISSILQVKKDSCFTAPRISFCGNFKVEDDEGCDAGPNGRAGNDSCCNSQCQLKLGANCSDTNSDCCHNCQFAPMTTVCWNSSDDYMLTSCRATSYCTGNDTTCPVAKVEDGKQCLNGSGHCMNGECKDICEFSGLISCVCDEVDQSCQWCCKPTANATCLPYVNSSGSKMNVANGYPCVQGYCDAGQCRQSKINGVNRLWSLIQHLDVNQLRLFMLNNLVLATIILSLIPYLIFCIVICCIDCKKERKVKFQNAWLHKHNDELILDKNAFRITKIEGIHYRPKRSEGM